MSFLKSFFANNQSKLKFTIKVIYRVILKQQIKRKNHFQYKPKVVLIFKCWTTLICYRLNVLM